MSHVDCCSANVRHQTYVLQDYHDLPSSAEQAAVTQLHLEATIYIVDCRGDHKCCKDNAGVLIDSVMLQISSCLQGSV